MQLQADKLPGVKKLSKRHPKHIQLSQIPGWEELSPAEVHLYIMSYQNNHKV